MSADQVRQQPAGANAGANQVRQQPAAHNPQGQHNTNLTVHGNVSHIFNSTHADFGNNMTLNSTHFPQTGQQRALSNQANGLSMQSGVSSISRGVPASQNAMGTNGAQCSFGQASDTSNCSQQTGTNNNIQHTITPRIRDYRSGLLGQNNLPLIPAYLIPLEKKGITKEHCSRPEVWSHFWILDPVQRDRGCTVYDSNNNVAMERFMVLIGTLFENVMTQSRSLVEKRVCSSFKEEGFLWNGQMPVTLEDIKCIIKSRAMRERFEEDLLFPFCYTMKCVYSNTQESEVMCWMVKSLKAWAHTKQCPFDFNAMETDPTIQSGGIVKKFRHTIMKIGVKGTNYLSQQIHDAEEAAFGMTLRCRAMARNGSFHAKYHEIRVNLEKLGFNAGGVSTYLLVNKEKCTGDLGSDPNEEDLLNLRPNRLSFYSHLLAQEAVATGLRKEELMDIASRALEFMNSHSFVGRRWSNPHAAARLPSSSCGKEHSEDLMGINAEYFLDNPGDIVVPNLPVYEAGGLDPTENYETSGLDPIENVVDSTQFSFSNKIASNFAQKEHQRQNQHRQCVAEAEAAMIARQQHADHRHEQYIANARRCEHLQTRVLAGAAVSEEVSSLDCYNIARDPTTHLMNNKPQCNKSGAHQSLSENSLGKEPHVRAENVSEEVSFFRLLLY